MPYEGDHHDNLISDAKLACKLEGCHLLRCGRRSGPILSFKSAPHLPPSPPPVAHLCPKLNDVSETQDMQKRTRSLDLLYSANNGLCLPQLQHNQRHSCLSDVLHAHRYNRLVGQNATSLSRRFTRLHGLQPLLLTELSAMDTARTASLTTLNSLAQHCSNVTQAFVDQVHSCFQCRKYLTY